MGALDRGGDRIGVVAVDPLGSPAMRTKPLDLVVRHREAGRPVDRYRVIVVKDDQLVEPQMPGDRQCLVADTLHQAAIAAKDVSVMIDNVAAELVASMRSASAMPTEFANPWPSGPVVVSMPVA